ncbi:MAG: hypothetical protein KDI98_06180 [Hyphomicrobiaceae bacterium]|nr:hypothetical protein [Hyphomicrobiaceae bacterium]
MRIAETPHQLIVTDQSFGWAAFLTALGAFLLALVAADLVKGAAGVATALQGAFAGLALAFGLRGMSAWQLIVDRDEKTLLYREWKIAGVTTRRATLSEMSDWQVEGEARAVLVLEGPAPPIRVGACRMRHHEAMRDLGNRLNGVLAAHADVAEAEKD